jgi:hypothetical protein
MQSILFLVLMLATLGPGLYIFSRNRAMKRRQNAMVEKLSGKRYWRINLASPAFFQRFLRVLPFEAKGVLIDEDESFRIQGFWLKTGGAFESVVSKTNCTVEWLGNRTLRSGNLYWARLTTPKGPVLFCPDTGMNALPSREALADIFRSAFPHFALTTIEKDEFALEKNPRSLGAVAIFFALMLFALLDSFVITKYELADAQIAHILRQPLAWLMVPMSLAATLALLYRFFSRGNIPSRESMVLAMLLCAVLAGSTVPMLKRIDQSLAHQPTQNYVYVVTRIGHLEPKNASLNLPKMRFLRANEYWSQFPVETEYQIPFLRGPMGLWQLDHAVFDPPIVEYYKKH